MATLPQTDLAASGSVDGSIRVWHLHPKFRGMTLIFSVVVPGIVNGMSFSPDGAHLALALGQEPRLGRWYKYANGKNALILIELQKKQ